MSVTVIETADFLRQHLRLEEQDRVYGVVDGAQDYSLAFDALKDFKSLIRPLFEGPSAARLNHVAPYLVPINPFGEYLERWMERWGRSVGILLVTRADPGKLYQHLRKLFVARDERDQEYFFRYYDPRVLRVYLPTCTAAEVTQFFGPIERIIVEGANPEVLLNCTLSVHGTCIEEWPFMQAGPTVAACFKET